jgi:hypothetical protein
VIAFPLPPPEISSDLPPVEQISNEAWDSIALLLWDAAERGAGDQNQASNAQGEQDQDHHRPQG